MTYKFGPCGDHAASRRPWKPGHPRSPPPTTHGIAADRDWPVQVREFPRSNDVRELGYYDDLRTELLRLLNERRMTRKHQVFDSGRRRHLTPVYNLKMGSPGPCRCVLSQSADLNPDLDYLVCGI